MQCSDLFCDVFDSHCAGNVRTCECGITHFDTYNTDDYDYEERELEELEQRAKNDPDHYVAHDHSIGTMEISGVEIVYGCSCNLAKKYEGFILMYAEQLAEFLNRRGEILREQAKKTVVNPI